MADFYINSDYYPENYDAEKRLSGIEYEVVTDLATEPVDLAFFKQQARIDYNLDDNLCEIYIKAARQELEQYAQMSFGVKTMSLRALYLPDNYHMMFNPASITGSDYELFGERLKKGGKEVFLEFITKDKSNETIKIAIARYAAGLYMLRENVIINSNGNPIDAGSYIDESKRMLKGFMNITFL